MMPTKRRRILERFKITEISGVDRPCAEHARVTIRKRAQEPNVNNFYGLEDRILELKDKADVLNKNLAARPEPARPSQDFDEVVAAVRRRDNCAGTDALTKARREAPKAFNAYRGDASATPGGDFDALVRDEMAKGLSYGVAAQRVILKHGARPDASRVRKSANATAEFMDAVYAVMIAKRCSRTDAMSEVRRRDPELFGRYQEL